MRARPRRRPSPSAPRSSPSGRADRRRHCARRKDRSIPGRTAAVVLAAGGATRFASGAKLLAQLDGRPLVAWAVDAALAADLDETIVVVGPSPIAEVLPAGATVVHNPAWTEGIATSLQAGVRTASALECDAVVVGLGDQPLVPASAWRAVAANPSPIAVATYAGVRRNPVRLEQSVWRLLPTSGDEGARAVMRERPDLVCEVPCSGDPADVDTVADLQTVSRAVSDGDAESIREP